VIKSNFGAKCEMIVNYIDNRTRKSISMVVIILFWLHNFYSLKDCIQHFAAWSSSDLTVFKKDWLVCVENIVGLRFRLNFFSSLSIISLLLLATTWRLSLSAQLSSLSFTCILFTRTTHSTWTLFSFLAKCFGLLYW